MIKTTVGELKSVISEALSNVVIHTADGKTYTGDSARISRALATFGANTAERNAIISGQIPISAAALSALKRDRVVASDQPVRQPKPFDWDKENRVAQRKSGAADKKLHAAAAKFARNWRNFTLESPDVSPEDAAPDAALGFFWEYPEWKEWAAAVRPGTMTKEMVRSLVTDLVYDEMIKGSKRK